MPILPEKPINNKPLFDEKALKVKLQEAADEVMDGMFDELLDIESINKQYE